MRRKTFYTAAALTAFVVMLGITPLAGADAKEKYEEKFEKTVSLARDGKVTLKNIAGDIVVKTWNRAEVKIDALKVSQADTEEKAKEGATKVKIQVYEEGDIVRIETEYPRNGLKNISVSVAFDLMIPEAASAQINSISGDINISDLNGDAKADSVSGDVILANIGGMLKGHSVSGDVEVMKAGRGANCDSVSGNLKIEDVQGDAELKTVSGSISLNSCRGSVAAESVSGNVDMTGVTEAETVKAKTLSGKLKYEGDLAADGRYSLNSHSGRLVMRIPAGSAFDLEARTFSGDITTEFEVRMTGTISKKKLSGEVNGGGAEVNIKTFSGDVSIEKR